MAAPRSRALAALLALALLSAPAAAGGGCAPGSFGTAPFSSCTLCAAGSFSTTVNATACTPCAAGSYYTTTGSTQCTLCLAGSFSTAVSATSASTCVPCAAGSYASSTGATACTACAAGTSSAAVGASLATTCVNCAAGSYSLAAGSSSCTQCPAGYASAAVGASTNTCVGCAMGTYAAAPGSGVCTSCAAGYWSSALNATTSATCTACVAGTTSTTVGATSALTCVPCVAGTYSGNSAWTAACTNCPIGSWSALPGQTSAAACTSCAAGTSSAVLGASSAATCVPCVAGTWTTSGGLGGCTGTPCPAGQFGPSGQIAYVQCQLCPAGSYGPTTGASACVQCAAGMASSFAGVSQPSTCTTCSAGTWATAGSATCTPCSAGTYSPFAAAGSSAACLPCLSGTYSNSAGATSCSSGLTGSFCPAGQAGPVGSTAVGGALCSNCASATYSYGGSASCAACSPSEVYVTSVSGCVPASAVNGPTNGIAFYLSGAAAEGISAFAIVSQPSGINYVTDHLGNLNGALAIASGSYISTPSYTAAPAYYPTGAGPMSIAAWVQCAPFSGTSEAAVFQWGSAGPATSGEMIAITAAGSLAAGTPGPLALCDNTWHHAAIVAGDGGVDVFKTYIDGSLVGGASLVDAYSIPATGTGALATSLRVGFNGNPTLTTTKFTAGTTQWTVPAGVTTIYALVVAGGGGGGGTTDRSAGGGGGGGVVCTSITVTPGQVLTATVGAGGAGGTNVPTVGLNGGNSIFGPLLAYGGGGGGAGCNCATTYVSTYTGATVPKEQGVSGGSGGGIAHDAFNTYPPGNGVAGQGYAGNKNSCNGCGGTSCFVGTGGGGAGGIGGPAQALLPGNYGGGYGGPGVQCPYGGTALYGGGGGGGAQSTSASAVPAGWGGGKGGLGGGGTGCLGTSTPATASCTGGAGTPNTGGGGGGSSYGTSGSGTGGAGGSGVIIIQYVTTATQSQDLFAGAVSDLRLYNRAMLSSEVLTLSQPPLPTYVGVPTPTLAAGSTSYAYAACQPGYFGTSTLTLTKNTTNNIWSQTGSVSCTICPSGTWTNTSSAASCIGTPCAAGSAAVPGATSALAAQCTLCSTAGTYSPAGAAACLPCGAGTYSASTTGAASCSGTLCSPGQYGPIGQTTLLATPCFSCAAGSYSNTTGAQSCVLCPPGTFLSSQGASSASLCLPCLANSYSFGGAAACSTCTSTETFVSATTGCAPPPSTGPLSGLAFFLSGSSAEGVAAFGPAIVNASGLTYVADLLSVPSNAISLSTGTYLSTPTYATNPLYYPFTSSVSMSASVWINCPAATGSTYASVFEWGTPAVEGAGLKFGLAVAPAWTFTLNVPGVFAGPSACDGTWHHLAVSQDNLNSVQKKYLDGVLVSTISPLSYSIPASGNSMRLGWNGNAANTYIEFTAVGTTTFTVPTGVTTIYALVVAGGGGGGGTNDRTAGGGGAGGLVCTSITVVPGQVLTVQVGGGGIGGVGSAIGSNGGNSVFGSSGSNLITAVGGGGGGCGGTAGCEAPGSGGSGGGISHDNSDAPGSGTAGQGHSGGTPGYNSGSSTGTFTGSGGGGAGTAGGGGSNSAVGSVGGGPGGAGATCSLTGSTLYAGGGGGGAQDASTTAAPPAGWGGGVGGAGGGGNGCTSTEYPVNQGSCTGGAGAPNTGGGGGGSAFGGSGSGTGGAGGSGIIVIAFATPGAGVYTGAVADMRLYNRVLLQSEILVLSAPPLPYYPGAVNPVPTAGVLVYAWTLCAGGFFGTASLTYTKNTLTNSWSSTGSVSCTACPLNTYSYQGATSGCSSCPTSNPATTLISPSLGCLPNTGPVSGLGFYLSGSAAEGTNAFASVAGTPTYVSDHNGWSGGAMSLSPGSYLATGVFPVIPSTLPTGGMPVSLSAWISCSASYFTSSLAEASVFEWGQPGLASSVLKAGLSATGTSSSTCGALTFATPVPGPIGGVCDSTWHHLAITQGDGLPTTFKQYVDGVLTAISPANFAYNLPTTLSSLRVGWNGGPINVSFTTVGTTIWTVPVGVIFVNVMIVAGGGGGGGTSDRSAGGGGAGGLVCTSLTVTPGQNITIVVGAGGLGGVGSAIGSNGGNSVFGSTSANPITAVGGGGGGCGGTAGCEVPNSGGSGGGISHDNTYAAGSGTAGQGYGGGLVSYNSGSSTGTFAGSGGGGAGGSGGNGVAPTSYGGGYGGPGATCLTAGVYYAGGGGGGAQDASTTAPVPAGWAGGIGGIGGGGNGCTSSEYPINQGGCTGGAGAPSTGGGGGGGAHGGSGVGTGGAGGSGIVMITYAAPSGAPQNDFFSGAVSDLRLYSRALSASEVAVLSQPPLAAVVNYTTPVAVAGATSYSWLCSPGNYGLPQVLTKNTALNTWSLSGAANVCLACSAGMYCPLGTQVNTQPCAQGYYCVGNGAGPAACALGYSTVNVGSATPAACQACVAGYYSYALGVPCTACPLGSYSTGSGSTSCVSCVAGTYMNAALAPGQSSISVCTPCAAGTYSATIGAFSASACLPCSPGISCPAGSTVNTLPCPAGFYCLGGVPGAQPCPPGTSSSTIDATICVACSPGFFAVAAGSPSCTPCPSGSYSVTTGATSASSCISSAATLQALAWSAVPPPATLALAGAGYSAGVVNRTTAIFLGGDQGTVSTAYPTRLEFDLASGTLAQVADAGTTASGSFHQDRAATTTTPDGRLWSFGGITAAGGVETNTMAYFTPSAPGGGWTVVAPPTGALPPPRKRAAMAYLSNCTTGTPYQCLVLFGGDVATSPGASTYTRFGDLWVYFFTSNTWLQPTQWGPAAASAPPPTTAAAISASLYGNAAYIFGGDTASGASSQLYVVDPIGSFFSTPLTSEMNNVALGAKATLSTTASFPVAVSFTNVGTTTWTVPAGVTTVYALVVAGGGGGGGSTDRSTGGGGAGGLICTTVAVTPGQVITVTVGAGGLGGSTAPTVGQNGGNSVFGALTAIGGGGGGGSCNCATTYVSAVTGATLYIDAGVSGGSGGGISHDASGTYTAGSGTAGQGYPGSSVAYNSGSSTGSFAGSGGGGAGGPGQPGVALNGGGGAGGVGLTCPLLGSNTFYAGGGGGGAQDMSAPPTGWVGGGAGGVGGGGTGCTSLGQTNGCVGGNAVANTGGGGGGAAGSSAAGGNGGSGIVMLVYPSTSNKCNASFATDGNIPLTLQAPASGLCDMAVTAGASAITAASGPPAVGTGEYAPWFYVDLGALMPFSAVTISTRANTDMGAGHFAGYQIYYASTLSLPSPSFPGVATSGPGGTQCPGLPGDLSSVTNLLYCAAPASRYVWLFLPASASPSRNLYLSEFQVWQRQPWIWRQLSGYSNVALQQTVIASSVAVLSVGAPPQSPQLATDGVLTNSGSSAAQTAQPAVALLPPLCSSVFLTVDLGAVYQTSAVAIWGVANGDSGSLNLYIGNNRDFNFNALVLKGFDTMVATTPQLGHLYSGTCTANPIQNVPTAAVTGASCWTYVLPAPISGRYLNLVKTATSAAVCPTYIDVGEVQAYSQRLANQPSPRSNMAYTTFRGAFWITGGIDNSGYLHNEVQLFDLTTGTWGAPLAPLGTPPSARTAGALLPVANSSSGLYYNVPSTTLAYAGGFDASGNPLGDLHLLTLPACAPSPYFAIAASPYIATETCTSAGTVCSYLCMGGLVAANSNGNTIVCSVTGQWIGSLPVCVPPTNPSTSITAPSSSTAVLAGFTSATVSWTQPSTGVWPIVGYKVSTVANDFLEQFVSYLGMGLTTCTACSWSIAPTDGGLTDSVYSIDASSGALLLNNQENSGITAYTGTVPYPLSSPPNNALTLLRAFPTLTPALNPDGDWAVECFFWLDTTTANQIVPGQTIGLCMYDSGFVRNTGSGLVGTCQFTAGLRNSGGVLQYGWESVTAATTSNPGPSPYYSATGWNNWYVAPQGAAWVRIERRGLSGASPALLGSWRCAFKFQAASQWLYLPDVGTDARVANHGFTSPMATSLRFGLLTNTWLAGTNSRLLAYFQYLRVAPLAACEVPGSTRVTANATTLSTTVSGLTANSAYQFQVQTIAPSGFMSAPAPVSGSVTAVAFSTTPWAANLPAFFAAGTVVDALSATPYSKTLYASSVWNNNIAGFGPQLGVDGSVLTGYTQAGNGGGYWLPAGPSANLALASSYTGTSYTGGANNVVSGLGDFFAIDLGIQTSVKAFFIAGRQGTCCIGRTLTLEFWVGNVAPPYYNETQRCDPSLMPLAALNNASATVTDPYTLINAPYSGFFQCTLPGRYVYVRSPNVAGTAAGFGQNQYDGQYNFAEVRVYASNLCPARLTTNGMTNTPTACSGTNVIGGSVYGAVCVQVCPPGYQVVSGSGIANCDGDNWDQLPLVCSPVCPLLPAPALVASCSQTLFTDSFSSSLSLLNWMSPQPLSQAIGSVWFAPDGALEASNKVGCNDQMLLLAQAASLPAYAGDFQLAVSVSPQGATQAGVVFFATPNGLSYMRFLLDASGLGLHTLDRVVNGVITRITDVSFALQPFSTHSVLVSWSASAQVINVTVDGMQVLSASDGTFTQGIPGVFAATQALFYSFAFNVPCSNGCFNALNGAVCTFSCHAGLLPTGPTARACSAGTGAAWVPDPVANPLVCVVPPPTFTPTTLSVSEAAAKNALVGQPLLGSSLAPDYQLQWAILAEMPNNTAVGTIFTINLCTGQVTLRQAGIMNYVTVASSYTLVVQASIAGFTATSSTVQNIVVNVLEVDTPPIIAPLTTLSLTENPTYGTPLSPNTPYFWDRENSTLAWSIVTDTSGGLFVVNASTGVISLNGPPPAGGCCTTSNTSNWCESSSIDFESAQGSTFTLELAAVQTSYCCGTAPFPAVTGNVLVQLVDADDAPLVASNQLLTIPNPAAVQGAFVGIVLASDQDTASTPACLVSLTAPGCWYSAESFSLVAPAQQTKFAVCTPSAASPGSVPFDATGSAPLFTITTPPNNAASKIALLNISATAVMPAWDAQLPFPAFGILVRAVFTVCVNVSDAFGAWSVGAISVAIQANTNTSVVTAFSPPAAGLNTTGGDTLLFTGSSFGVIQRATATYVGSLGVIYTAPSCTVVSATVISCKTAPGVGAGLVWSLFGDGLLIPSLVLLATSYRTPIVTSVSANLAQIDTTGGAAFNVVFMGQVGTFPPSSAYPIVITYGSIALGAPSYTCATLASAAPNASVTCTPPAGYGTGLPWTLAVGGQTTVSSNYPAAWPLFGYNAPTIATAAPTTPIFNLTGLNSIGGDSITLTGNNFGAPGSPVVVTFGGASGTIAQLTGCTGGHTSLTCTTVPGVGTGHRLQVALGGQSLTAPYVPPAGGFSYKPPVITSVSGTGATGGPTVGGAVLTLTGSQFGPVAGPLGMSLTDGVTYGHAGSLTTFSALPCSVVAAGTQMQCTTAPGCGAGLGVIMTLSGVGGLQTAQFQANISYAPPQINGFSGLPATTGGHTVGGDQVVINGINFGPGTSNANYLSYFQPLMRVQYGVLLIAGPFANLTFFEPANNCTVTTPSAAAPQNQAITCTTQPGAGHNLAWQVTLDGLVSTAPTTFYAPPAITSITNSSGAAVLGANVNGGDIVWILGSNFGLPIAGKSLVQKVTYGPTGFELTLPAANYNVTSDTKIVAFLPPGSGQNLKFGVAVADQQSVQSAATFSYAQPAILLVLPSSGLTQSNSRSPTLITVVATNLPLLDPNSVIGVLFGNGAYALSPNTVPTLQLNLPSGATAIAAATNADKSINFTFAQPNEGSGAGLGVRITITPAGSSVPSYTTPVAYPSGYVAVFSYLPPTISSVTVQSTNFISSPIPNTTAGLAAAQAAGFVVCPFPVGSLTWSCTDNSLRLIQIQGANFGLYPTALPSTYPSVVSTPASLGVDHLDGVTKVLDLVIYNDTAQGGPIGVLWSSTQAVSSIFLYSWTHTAISFYTTSTGVTPLPASALNQGSLKITETWTTWNGTVQSYVLPQTFVSLNPAISGVTGTSYTGVPTTGGNPAGTGSGVINLIVANGASIYPPAAQIWVGCLPGQCPSGQTAGVQVPATSIINAYLTGSVVFFADDPAVGTYLRGFNSTTTAPLNFVMPPGQGQNLVVQLLVYRPGCLSAISPTACPYVASNSLLVSYAPPAVSFVATITTTDAGVVVSTPQAATTLPPYASVTVPTNGSAWVAIYGTNLGNNPTIILGDSVRLVNQNPLVYSVVTPCNAAALSALPGALSSGYPNGHTCWMAPAPAGEGSGSLYQPGLSNPPYYPLGFFQVQIEAGPSTSGLYVDGFTQLAPQVIAFYYRRPDVRTITPAVSSAGLPTSGGSVITIMGYDFGNTTMQRPTTEPVVTFVVPGASGASFPCINAMRSILSSNTLITCTTTEGSGLNLNAIVTVRGVTSTSPGVFSYSPPTLVSATLVPNATWIQATGDSAVATAAMAAIYLNSGAPASLNMSGGASAAMNVPNLTALSGALVASPGAANMTLLQGVAVGGDVLVLQGSNFGAPNPSAALPGPHCAFLAWTFRNGTDPLRVPTCDGVEDFLGEGEVNSTQVLFWSHTLVAFVVQPGLGTKDIELNIRGNLLSQTMLRTNGGPTVARFRYAAPVIASLSISSGAYGYVPVGPSTSNSSAAATLPEANTDGGDFSMLSGVNFGPAPLNMTLGSETNLQVPLWLAPSLPTAYLVTSFHRACLVLAKPLTTTTQSPLFRPWYAEAQSALGIAATQVQPQQACVPMNSVSDSLITFASQPGVGANHIVQLFIVEDATYFPQALNFLPPVAAPGEPASVSQLVSNNVSFSYLPPTISAFQPQTVPMSPAPGSADAQVSMYGLNFGDEELALSQGWSPAELAVGGQVGSTPCDAVLRSRQNETGGTFTVLTCSFSTANLACGYSNFTVSIAGQAGFAPAQPTYLKVNGAGSQFQPLLLVCDVNFYGHLGETCLPCPAQVPATPILTGAYCAGYRPYSSASNPIDPAAFTYPVPLAGNYNLNSSDTNTLKWGAPGESQMEACPSGFQQQQGGRDVCIVQCTNTAACLGNNLCAYGYASKPPLWACSYCDTGFYESAGSCIKCPDSPYALIIGFCLLVVVAGCIGYFMNQKGVNIAVVSIGLDFFQVLAIFATAGVKWPPVILQLFQVLSAFNLNIQIVAPDCIVPNITYKQEFWFIMLLPLLVGSVFGLIFLGIFAHKALVMGVAKKDWFTHRPALVASGLALVYILYLYLTRTVFDIFNCNPKPVPDGCLHLNVAHGECCGVPGGTQLTLLPYAIAGLIVYSFGYPAFIGYTIYKNRELAMLDQLLKAKGTGDDKLSNPLAYDLRMTYGRSYFQFKPDFCMWILAIICRKFFIAITGAVFGKNSSFQMAACLMIMFLAYSAQMIFRPYMNSGEFEDVLKSHAESAFTSVLHARIRTHIANIETRGRKKARKNLLNFEGKVDRSAVLGLLTSWLFNYNTIEQIMLFCAVIVCLMGIMYQANASDTFQGANDGVTAVVMITIIFAILYYFTVLFTEIVILYNEDSRARQVAKQMRLAGSAGRKDQKSGKGTPRSGMGSTGMGRLVDEEGEINAGKVDTQNNPLFMNMQGGGLQGAGGAAGGGGGSGSASSDIAGLLNTRQPPSQELWSVFVAAFQEKDAALMNATAQLNEAKRMQTRSEEVDEAPHPRRAGKKSDFAPTATASSSAGTPGVNPMKGRLSLKALGK